MSDRKNVPTGGSVDAVLDTAADEARRRDAADALALMSEATGAEPVAWGASMVGFGRQPYTTADGKEREWFAVGFSPRKAALTFYGLVHEAAGDPANADLLERLGPHTTGKGCLYVKHLDAVDRGVLTQLVQRAWRENHRPA
jgi:hypothetical protein